MATDALEECIAKFKYGHLPQCSVENNEAHHNQACFQIDEWRCQHDPSVERVKYYSPDPNRTLREIEYEGWRRHVPARRAVEGPRFIFHIRPGTNSLKIQADLARLVDDSSFREMGCWLEPISMDFEDPILAVNFCEDSIEQNAEYVDELFSRINKIEKIPEAIIINLKFVIAHSCVERFKDKIKSQGFAEGLQQAIQLLRTCALNGISSPYYAAAFFCQENRQDEAAVILIRNIHKFHWQYEDALALERSIYYAQIDTLLAEISRIKREKVKLQEELFKLMYGEIILPTTDLKEDNAVERNKGSLDLNTELITSNGSDANIDQLKISMGDNKERNLESPSYTDLPQSNWHLHITEYHRPFAAAPIIFTKLEKFRQPKISEIPLHTISSKPKTTPRA